MCKCENPRLRNAFEWEGEITCVNCGEKLSKEQFTSQIMSD